MALSDLKDVDFVTADTDTVKEWVFSNYTAITGRTVADGDPVRLFLLFIVEDFVRLLNNVNDTGKMNLLKYSTGDYLDQLGALLGVTRIASSAATTTIKVTLSAARTSETIIPAGTRVSPEDDDIYFATDSDLVIAAGATEGTIGATCTTAGTGGNGYTAGEIIYVVDPVAYVASMENTTTSEGGAATETDDALRERIYEAPEHFSVAGPHGAYEYYTKSVNSNIASVGITSPSAGTVQIVPLLTDGEIPGQELIDEIKEKLSADDVRPLTDNVLVVAPTKVSYDIVATYYIDDTADASTVQANINTTVSEYTLWQKSALGRDIDPSELVRRMKSVSGARHITVTSPTYTAIDETQLAVVGSITVTMAGSES